MKQYDQRKQWLQKRRQLWLYLTLSLLFIPLATFIVLINIGLFFNLLLPAFAYFMCIYSAFFILLISFVAYSFFCGDDKLDLIEDKVLKNARQIMFRNICFTTFILTTLILIPLKFLFSIPILALSIPCSLMLFFISLVIYNAVYAKKYPQYVHTADVPPIQDTEPPYQFTDIEYPEFTENWATDPTDPTSMTNPVSPTYPSNLIHKFDD